MEELVKVKASGEIRQTLPTMWKEETEFNERISEKRWKRNQDWLNRYEQTFLQNHTSGNPFIKLTTEYIIPRRNKPVPETRSGNNRQFQQRASTVANNAPRVYNRSQTNANTEFEWREVRRNNRGNRTFQYSWQRNRIPEVQQRQERVITIPESDEDAGDDNDSDDFLEASESTETIT